MKLIPKNLLDELISANRSYWLRESDALDPVRNAAMALEKATGVCAFAWWNFIGDTIKSTGFIPNASDEEIYSILRAMGFEIVEENI